MLILGLFPYFWDQATWFSNEYRLINSSNSELYSEIVITIVFFGITMIYEEILSLPFTLYFTFVIEQKHGFNKQTLFLFFTDKIKVIGLTAVIGIPVLSVIIWIIKLGGEYFYFYIWAFLFVFRCLIYLFKIKLNLFFLTFFFDDDDDDDTLILNKSIIMMTIYPEYIAPLFNKYTKLENGEIFDSVSELAKSVSFPLTKLFVVDG